MKRILLILLTFFSLTSFGQPLMGIISSSQNNAVSSSTLLNGLVAYWKMDEASGNAIDKVSSYAMTPVNTPTENQTGKIGTSFSYVRTSTQHLVAPTATLNSVFHPGTSSFSITAWVYVSTGQTSTIRGYFGLSGTNFFYLSAMNDNKWRVNTNISGTAVTTLSNAALTEGQWYHIATVFDRAGYINMWIDGVKQTAQQSIAAYSTFDMGLGRTYGAIGSWGNSASYTWQGSIDEIKVWFRVITEAEITEDRNNGLAGTALIP